MKNKMRVYNYQADYRESYNRDEESGFADKKLGEERRERIHGMLCEEPWARSQTALAAVWPYTLHSTSMSLCPTEWTYIASKISFPLPLIHKTSSLPSPTLFSETLSVLAHPCKRLGCISTWATDTSQLFSTDIFPLLCS